MMANKVFNLFDKGAARCVHFTVPSGRRDASQRMPTEVNKTDAVFFSGISDKAFNKI